MSFLVNKNDKRIFSIENRLKNDEKQLSIIAVKDEGKNKKNILEEVDDKTIQRKTNIKNEVFTNNIQIIQDSKLRKIIKINKSKSKKKLTNLEMEYFLEKIIYLLKIERSIKANENSFLEKMLTNKSVTFNNYFEQLFMYIYREKLQKKIFANIDNEVNSSPNENMKSHQSSSHFSSSKKEDLIQSRSLKSSSSRERKSLSKHFILKKLYIEILYDILAYDRIKLKKKESKELSIFLCKIIRLGIVRYHSEQNFEDSKNLFKKVLKMTIISLKIINKKVGKIFQ